MKLLKTNFLPLLVVSVLVAGLLTVGVYQAKAVGNASFTQDTTVALDVGNFIIVGGSDADTVTASNTQITVTISTGQLLTIDSPDRKILSNDIGYSYSCSSDKSSIVIDTTTTTKTVVITPSSGNCGSTGGGSGGGGGGGGITTTPTPTPTLTPTPTPTVSPGVSPTPTPSISSGQATPILRGFTNLAAVSLKDGDVISAAGSSDPDIYIVNPHGYKRLFLNPAIFGFYGHLGGFSKVKAATSVTRDIFVTSGLFRNCETDDPKVYGVETTGEDTGVLHWVNTTGEQAVTDDADFFKKVFCINTNEFSWYPKGSDYTSVNQIPNYARGSISSSTQTPVLTAYKVVSSVGYLNIRASAATASSVLGQLAAGDIITSLGKDGIWHKIKFEGKDGWVHGDYLTKI